jgi:CBS domain-containing protein
MLVRDVMTSPVVTVHVDDGLDRAARLLREHGVRALPVVDGGGHVLGMVTETDVVRDAVPRDPWARDLHPSASGPHPASVRDVMSFHPVALLPDVELPVAADLLVSGHLTSLPVVEDGVVVGILTRHDLVALLAPPTEEQP